MLESIQIYDFNLKLIWHSKTGVSVIWNKMRRYTKCKLCKVSVLNQRLPMSWKGRQAKICYAAASSTDCSSEQLQIKHQSSALVAFCGGIHRWEFGSPQKGPVMRKTFLCHDVITEFLNRGPGIYQSHFFAPLITHSMFMWPSVEPFNRHRESNWVCLTPAMTNLPSLQAFGSSSRLNHTILRATLVLQNPTAPS